MIDEMRMLIDLQKNFDKQLFIKEELSNPSIFKELKTPYEEMVKERKEKEDLILELQKKQELLEIEVNEKKEEIKGLRQKLQMVRNQKEYSEILNGIDGIQKILSSKEDEILQIMENLENEKKLFEEKKLKWKPIEEAYLEAENKWNELKKNYESELHSLELEEKIIKEKLPKNYYLLFNKILKLRKGQAVVPVVDGSCSGCHILLRPQQIADVKSGNFVIQCDQCQRILFVE